LTTPQKGDLRDFLEKRKLELKNEVESSNSNYVLNVNEDDFCQYLASRYSLVVPKIYEDKIYVYDQKEVDINVSRDQMRFIIDRSRPFCMKGIQVKIACPFDGDGELFQYRPSTSTYNPPRGEIVGQEIHLIYRMVDHDAGKLKQMYQRELGEIKRYIEWIQQEIGAFNNSLESFVRQFVFQRKRKLLDDVGLVSSLGIPVRRRADLPETYSIPSIRKKPKFEPPEAPKGPFKPEPALPSEEYESILEIIYNMALVMERSPQTFSKLEEEEIRDHFLMILNANYEGQATGETFNYKGKTDILIRIEGKNVFIAECKFWRGEKKFSETIDQLLGYTGWRDTKTAILLFNKNQDFSSVLNKINPTVKAHPCYKREWSLKSDKLKTETIFSYIFHQPQDVNREIILTILAFDVPR
jgi:hypothetical protein